MKTARANQVVDELVHQDLDQATRGASREIATLRNIQLEEAQDAFQLEVLAWRAGCRFLASVIPDTEHCEGAAARRVRRGQESDQWI